MDHSIPYHPGPVTRECPDCKGYGEIIMPNSYYRAWDSDPANRYPVMCGLCRGIGEVDDE